MQLGLTDNDPEQLPVEKVQVLYDKVAASAKTLMTDKNHDYGEAWRDMSQTVLLT